MDTVLILGVAGAAILGLVLLLIFMATKRSWRRGTVTPEEAAMIAADPELLNEEPTARKAA